MENKDESLTITTRGDPYSVTEITKPMLPTRSFRWRWSWNTKAETAAIMQKISTTGIAVMATFTCNNIYSSQNVQRMDLKTAVMFLKSRFPYFYFTGKRSFSMRKKLLKLDFSARKLIFQWNHLAYDSKQVSKCANKIFFGCMKRVTWLTFPLFEANQK